MRSNRGPKFEVTSRIPSVPLIDLEENGRQANDDAGVDKMINKTIYFDSLIAYYRLIEFISFAILSGWQRVFADRNTDSARKLSRASYIVSIVGVIVGAIVITIVLSVMLTACFYPNCPHGWRYTSTSSCAVCCPDWDVLSCYY